jgi:hypothetical protein
MNNRKLRVFLCYTSRDKPIVQELYHHLATREWIDPWLDKFKLIPGQDWDLEIHEAIEKSDAIIVCLSTNSVTKEGYVQKEIRKALDIADEKPEGTIFIIPLRLDNCEVPRKLGKFQHVNLFPDEELEWAYKRIFLSLNNRAISLGINKSKKRENLLLPHSNLSGKSVGAERENLLLPYSNLSEIKPDKLKPFAAVTNQIFDPFWVPEKLLRKMINQHLSLNDVASQLSHITLSQLYKILLYSQQIVIHQSSLLDNEIIEWNCLSPENRDAFCRMLNQDVLILYLTHFNDSNDTPAFSISSNSNIVNLWRRIFSNTKISYIRLDWQKANMASTYHGYFQSLNMPNYFEFLSHSLKIPKLQRTEFKKTLNAVASYAFDLADRGQVLTRTQLYENFVCVEHTNPVYGFFADKPFAVELKQIFDLKYNHLLREKLSRFSEITLDTPARDAMVEMNTSTDKHLDDSAIEKIIKALSRMEFLPKELHKSENLVANDLSYLSLNDILFIRESIEWKNYSNKLDRLALNSVGFLFNGIQDFLSSFFLLNEKVFTVNTAVRNKARNIFYIALFIKIGNSLIKIYQKEFSQNKILVETMGSTPKEQTHFQIDLIISSYDEQGYENKFIYPILLGKVSFGLACFNEILSCLRKSPQFFLKNLESGSNDEIYWNDSIFSKTWGRFMMSRAQSDRKPEFAAG